jgi:hypothetical protein
LAKNCLYRQRTCYSASFCSHRHQDVPRLVSIRCRGQRSTACYEAVFYLPFCKLGIISNDSTILQKYPQNCRRWGLGFPIFDLRRWGLQSQIALRQSHLILRVAISVVFYKKTTSKRLSLFTAW